MDGPHGLPWRQLPDEYSKCNSVFRRYRRWATTGVFDAMLETLAGVVERDASADMIDTTIVRHIVGRSALKRASAARRGLGGRGGGGLRAAPVRDRARLSRSGGGFTTKLHTRCYAQGRSSPSF